MRDPRYSYVWRLVLVVFLGISMSCGPFRSVGLDSRTGLFPTQFTVPQSHVVQYTPIDISGVSIVYLDASLSGGYTVAKSQYIAKHREWMLSHVRKIGPWRVTGNPDEVRDACGWDNTQAAGIPDPDPCARLVILINQYIQGTDSSYAVTITKYPEDLSVLNVRGRIDAHVDWDNEVNRPILNVLKRWYDDCAILEDKKHR